MPLTRTSVPPGSLTPRDGNTSKPTRTASAAQQVITRRDTVAARVPVAGDHSPNTVTRRPSAEPGSASIRSSNSKRSLRSRVATECVITAPDAAISRGNKAPQATPHARNTTVARRRACANASNAALAPNARTIVGGNAVSSRVLPAATVPIASPAQQESSATFAVPGAVNVRPPLLQDTRARPQPRR